jgi:methylenetetrahydrofolate--tRNA-(uracil-5-)-methyltransferase
MKPIGLELEGKERPYAVVQLRKENLAGAAYNLVGFQNRLKYGEQLRVFRMIPGLENASFNSLGSVHRNSFLNSRKLLHWDLSSKKFPTVHFAGQITGVEGYTESASMGLYVGYQILRKLQGRDEFTLWPKETAIGALVNYIMTVVKPVPSNINFGLLPAIPLNRAQRKSRDRKKIRKQLVAAKAAEVLDEFINREML